MFKYLRITTISAICYQGRDGMDKVLDMHGFVDVDFTGDLNRRISKSRYVFNLFGVVIGWMSKK